MYLIPFVSKTFKQTQIEVVCLNKELTYIEQAISDYQKQLYAFDRTYQNRLGDLAEAVLALRLELGIIENNNDNKQAITKLSDNLYLILKTAFKKAAKLCHPDYLSQQYQTLGLHYFDILHKAYKLHDLVTVEHILWLLETGQAFSQTPIVITNEALLNKRKQILLFLIKQKAEQLDTLKKQESYDVSNEDNWNILLYDYQTQLEDELAILRAKKSL